MRKLNTWRNAAIGALIVALSIVVACSQESPSAPTAEPDATTSAAESGATAGTTDSDTTTGTTDSDTTAGTTAPDATTGTASATEIATQEAVETIIDGILADLLDDATADLRNLEEEVEADLALVASEEQSLSDAGDSFAQRPAR